jgi:hypothetical protein
MPISVFALVEPIGSIKSWLRPNASTPLPGGWVICDGTTVVDASSPFNGLALPDLRARFPRGHATLTNANFGADAAYFAGGTIPSGGQDSIDLSHSHTVPTHAHSVVVNAGGTHTHTTTGAIQTSVGVLGPPGNISFGNDGIHQTHNHTMPVGGSHSHTGSTGTGGSSANSALGSNENRPSYDELLLIIKVK